MKQNTETHDPRPGKEPEGAVNGEGDESFEQVPLYRRRRIIIPLFIVLLAAVAGGWYWYVGLRDFVSTDDAYVDANKVSISSKVLGRIAHLGADEGDSVRQGEMLVQLDDADFLAQKEQAVASLKFAEESVKLAGVNMVRANDDFRRAEQQFKSAIITREQYDHARNSLEAARAEYSIALSRVGTARAQVGVVETQLENCSISSPVDGRIAKRWVLAGDVVQPGQPVFSVYDLKDTWVTANLEETSLKSVRLGQDVAISVDSYPDREFRGKVIQLGTYTAAQFSLIPPNNASGNFTKVTQRVPIKVSIGPPPNNNGDPVALLPGMSVEVRIKVR